MKEIWRDIKDYEGYYQVSNRGIVKSLNYRRTGKERIMKGVPDGYGYLQVKLCKDGKDKKCRINRLVAQAFIENPDNLPEVNHKDENPKNNCVENLEWCDRSYNINYGTRNKKAGKKIAEKLTGRKQTEEHIKKRAEKHSKPVYSIDKESGLITYWESAKEAGRVLGIDPSSITRCCKGKVKSAGGYTWHYVESEEVANEK